ncbi:protease [Seminavis robusta]|uniref:Protease n=1 Tax=Seminavis robusta TaxID=568900 RepID=A0A9N8D9G1_9STRA|nr:protease [Seminavis robusta]|eukprot:Sro23_g015900.1 protease (951) ;mRNA; r:99212-103509
MTTKGATMDEIRQLDRSSQQQRSNSARGFRLTDAEIEQLMESLEHEEEGKERTWARWFVETYLQHCSWYFPRKDIPGAPSLSYSWAYYERVTLPRHFVGPAKRRAEPNEKGETELYNPWKTKQKHLVEFGIGVDLYFQSVRAISIMFLVAALCNVPSIYHYAVNYSDDRGRRWGLEGSAECASTYWAYCEDCTRELFPGESASRLAEADDGSLLAMRNDCDVTLMLGAVNWFTWVFFFLFLTGMSMYQTTREIRFDEDKLTAKDYSVAVKNPPPDALDPDEWRDFFAQFAEKQVTLVSLHLDNEEMLRTLLLRRIQRDQLRRMLPKGTDLDDEDALRMAVDVHIRERDAEPQGCVGCVLEFLLFKPLRMFGLLAKAESCLERIDTLTEKIKELQLQEYELSKVYVTFETEEGQRSALEALSASRVDIIMNNTHNIPPSAIFRDRVLRVIDPTEPNAVRWQDLSDSKLYRVLASFANFIVTIGLIAVAGYCADITRQELGPRMSAALVAIFNGGIPFVLQQLMMFERHQTEGGYQSSLYFKITLFRWFNTAMVLQFITPFTSSISTGRNDLLPSISAILWAELFITPFIRYADFPGNLQKHILAPRAVTQEQMNLCFLGTRYNLGERYTDLTKVLFVCFFYSALFPASFFFGFAILLVQYYVDKICLVRIWGVAPSLGNKLAVFSRKYFFTGALVAFIISSAYAWAEFPYDNLCDPEGGTISKIIPQRNASALRFSDDKRIDVNVGQEEPVRFCHQGYRGQLETYGFNFPPSVLAQPDGLKWMTEDQETIVTWFYWSVILAMVAFFIIGFLRITTKAIVGCFRSNYEPTGSSQRIDFSCNQDIVAYFPSIKLFTYPFPFIAANIDDLDPDLVGFTDTDKHLDHWNLMFDVPFPGMHRRKRSLNDPEPSPDEPSPEDELQPEQAGNTERPIFGIVKHYPPDWWVSEALKKNR